MSTEKMTPQQALGEAKACLERAQVLLKMAAMGLPTFEASNAAHTAYRETSGAWCWLTTAKALDEAGK